MKTSIKIQNNSRAISNLKSNRNLNAAFGLLKLTMLAVSMTFIASVAQPGLAHAENSKTDMAKADSAKAKTGDNKAETKKDEKPKASGDKKKMTTVVIETSLGNIEVEINSEKAPISAENFLKYVDSKHYDGLIFHRIIKDFMIQGGGMNEKMEEKKNGPQIKNEATNGLKNDRGTIAMARTSVVDSATSQFFINTVDNGFLNHSAPTPQGYGYAVFGKVTSGMDTVDKIRAVPTGGGDVPKTAVVIKTIRRK